MSIANSLEQAMLKLINDERTASGVAPLQFDTILNDAAEDHSTSMLENNIFSHTGADGSTAKERMIHAGYLFEGTYASGENIAYQSERGEPGILDDVQDLHDSLMSSPGHRANILSPNFDEIGIGIVEGQFTSEGITYDSVMVTQNFARTDAEGALPQIVPTPTVTPDEISMANLPMEIPLELEKDEEPSSPVTLESQTQTPPEVSDIPEQDDQMEESRLPSQADDAETPIFGEAPESDTDLIPETTSKEEDDAPELVKREEDEPAKMASDDDADLDGEGRFPVSEEDVFVDDDDVETSQDGVTGEVEEEDDSYVWTKTHSDETYARVIKEFSQSCEYEQFATLDQELKAFVLREFDCNYDWA